MATRANIILRCGDKMIQYYQHWDGQIQNGVGLMLCMAKNFTFVQTSFFESTKELLLKGFEKNLKYIDPSFEKEEEIDFFYDSLHKDIEYLYVVTFEDKKIRIQYIEVEPFTQELGSRLIDRCLKDGHRIYLNVVEVGK